MTLFVGLAEAAGLLEWDKRKLAKYRDRGVFPKPFQQLASGPIWTVDQIRQYQATRDGGISIYYHDGQEVYQCFFDRPMVKTAIEVSEIHGREYAPMLCITNEQVDHLRRAISNPDLVHFIGPSAVAAYYNFGLITEGEYNEYLERVEQSRTANFNFAGSFRSSRKFGYPPMGSVLEALEEKGIFQRNELPKDPEEAKKYIMNILNNLPEGR